MTNIVVDINAELVRILHDAGLGKGVVVACCGFLPKHYKSAITITVVEQPPLLSVSFIDPEIKYNFTKEIFLQKVVRPGGSNIFDMTIPVILPNGHGHGHTPSSRRFLMVLFIPMRIFEYFNSKQPAYSLFSELMGRPLHLADVITNGVDIEYAEIACVRGSYAFWVDLNMILKPYREEIVGLIRRHLFS